MQVPFLDVLAGYRELRDEIDAASARVLSSGRYILGEEVDAFEAAFAAYCGTRHCVGVANGLDALQLILRGRGIGPGDEVIVPAHTFIATWLAVSLVGARPVPIEPDAHTMNVDPASVEAAVTRRTRALIAVDLYGYPADFDALAGIASRHGLHLIEDAAQAHGAARHGRRAGSLADAAAFSFYPGKNLGAFGDGGAITTSDDDLAARIRRLRNYGSRVKYHHEDLGMNSRLDPLQAAMLAVKLRRLDAWNAHRRRIADLYLDRLDGIPGLSLPPAAPGIDSSWHLFVVRHDRRDDLARGLAAAGIETLIHYPVAAHLSGAYQDAATGAGSLPLTERLAATVLSLPIGPHLDVAAAAYVATSVRDAAGRA
jgi:dTDP-3-amino-3,4,6-trideoxy-alpha-D-glucose transaminase